MDSVGEQYQNLQSQACSKSEQTKNFTPVFDRPEGELAEIQRHFERQWLIESVCPGNCLGVKVCFGVGVGNRLFCCF